MPRRRHPERVLRIVTELRTGAPTHHETLLGVLSDVLVDLNVREIVQLRADVAGLPPSQARQDALDLIDGYLALLEIGVTL